MKRATLLTVLLASGVVFLSAQAFAQSGPSAAPVAADPPAAAAPHAAAEDQDKAKADPSQVRLPDRRHRPSTCTGRPDVESSKFEEYRIVAEGRQRAGVPAVRPRQRDPVRSARRERRAARRAVHGLRQDRLVRDERRLQLHRAQHRQRRPDVPDPAVAGRVAHEQHAAAGDPEHLGVDADRAAHLHHVRACRSSRRRSTKAARSTSRSCASAPTSPRTSRATSRSPSG